MQAAIQRTIDASPAFMEYGLEKKIAAWAHANHEPNKQEDWIQFCMKRLRTLKSFKIFKSEIKKLKTNSGLCAFKGLFNDTTLMQIQSGRTVPLITISPDFLSGSKIGKQYSALQRTNTEKFETNIPRKGIARPQSQFLHPFCE
jgi:hypothetical protein